MGATLLARSATASTGRRNASNEPQPEALILGLGPDQPTPGAAKPPSGASAAVTSTGPVAALIFQMPSSASRAARWPASTAPSIYPLQALAVSVAAHLTGPIGSLSAAPKCSRPHGPMFEL